MRGIGKHTPPADVQEEPLDNTSEYVRDQVMHFHHTGERIHPEVAREIAAWYQAPTVVGLPFMKFASTGTIDEDFLNSIRIELMKAGILDSDRDNLYALHTYIRSAKP